MAAGNFTLYRAAKKRFLDGTTPLLDLDTTALRAKLYKAGAATTLSAANSYSLLSQLGTTNETANVKGGNKKTITSCTVFPLSAGAATLVFDTGNLIFTASGGAISTQYMLIFQSASAGGGPLLGWVKLSTSGIEVTSTNTLTVNAPTNGWFVAY